MTRDTDPGTESDITSLLEEWSRGNPDAPEKLMPLVLDGLRQVAGRAFSRERVNHTLQPTALVNEVFLQLVDRENLDLRNRSHFYGVAAQMMRRILVSHARKHKAQRRGGDVRVLSLDAATNIGGSTDVDLIALDDALKDLARFDFASSSVVELRFFAGLSYPEIAEILDLPQIRVRRQWETARIWLFRELSNISGLD